MWPWDNKRAGQKLLCGSSIWRMSSWDFMVNLSSFQIVSKILSRVKIRTFQNIHLSFLESFQCCFGLFLGSLSGLLLSCKLIPDWNKVSYNIHPFSLKLWSDKQSMQMKSVPMPPPCFPNRLNLTQIYVYPKQFKVMFQHTGVTQIQSQFPKALEVGVLDARLPWVKKQTGSN